MLHFLPITESAKVSHQLKLSGSDDHQSSSFEEDPHEDTSQHDKQVDQLMKDAELSEKSDIVLCRFCVSVSLQNPGFAPMSICVKESMFDPAIIAPM